mgnify:CR=1 FL=1
MSPPGSRFFTITASENLTSCHSHYHPQECPRCAPRKAWEVIGELVETIHAGVRRSSPEAEVISWDWAWTDELARNLVPRLPRGSALMSVSEWSTPIERGGAVRVVLIDALILEVEPAEGGARDYRERARDRAKQLVSSVGDPRYRCILEAADSIRTLSAAEHERAKACLENLTAVDPSFALGYTFLAILYGREYQLGVNLPTGGEPVLDRALRAVRRSIELNPSSSRTWTVLMVVLFHRHEVPEAFAAAERL